MPLTLPRAAEARRARRTYARLEPLERTLDDLLTRRTLRLPRPRFASAATRLMWRQTSILNALGHLDAYLDRELFDRTRWRRWPPRATRRAPRPPPGPP